MSLLTTLPKFLIRKGRFLVVFAGVKRLAKIGYPIFILENYVFRRLLRKAKKSFYILNLLIEQRTRPSKNQ